MVVRRASNGRHANWPAPARLGTTADAFRELRRRLGLERQIGRLGLVPRLPHRQDVRHSNADEALKEPHLEPRLEKRGHLRTAPIFWKCARAHALSKRRFELRRARAREPDRRVGRTINHSEDAGARLAFRRARTANATAAAFTEKKILDSRARKALSSGPTARSPRDASLRLGRRAATGGASTPDVRVASF